MPNMMFLPYCAPRAEAACADESLRAENAAVSRFELLRDARSLRVLKGRRVHSERCPENPVLLFLAVSRHAGAIDLELHVAPGMFDIFLGLGAAFVDRLHARAAHRRRLLGDARRQWVRNREPESKGSQKLIDPFHAWPPC